MTANDFHMILYMIPAGIIGMLPMLIVLWMEHETRDY
jgi:hypothetical protein